MTAVLGIDAAWTATEPSGVALIRKTPDNGRWEYVSVAPSYNAFIAAANGTPVQWDMRPESGAPDPKCLLTAAQQHLGGETVSVVASDIPLSNTPITGRRECDKEISMLFGAQGCSTHSPSRNRPGAISTNLLAGLRGCGYNLATRYATDTEPANSVIEVYPHPALLTLLNRNYRVPCKVSRSLRYWPETTVQRRVDLLMQEFVNIYNGLGRVIHGIPHFLPPLPHTGRTLASLKRYEDVLDALVCAWVGALFFERQARAYGAGNAAIWVP